VVLLRVVLSASAVLHLVPKFSLSLQNCLWFKRMGVMTAPGLAQLLFCAGRGLPLLQRSGANSDHCQGPSRRWSYARPPLASVGTEIPCGWCHLDTEASGSSLGLSRAIADLASHRPVPGCVTTRKRCENKADKNNQRTRES
jgi:hypothetical protein